MPLPLEAQQVVERIRRDVQRPQELPRSILDEGENFLRFLPPGKGKHLRCCPLGFFFPSGGAPSPALAAEELGIPELACREFTWWWDRQVDPQAATDAVWPRQGDAGGGILT